MNNINIAQIRSWANDAGDIARRSFNHVASRRKPDRSWVTDADIAIEHMLVERINNHYPNHGIIGEEQTHQALDHEFLWALDPLDGTGSFVAGLPTWGISIGLLHHGTPHIGVIYLPLLDDCYWADTDGNAYLNNQPLHVAAPREWETSDWIAIPSDSHRHFTIDFPGKTRSLGCTIASLAYVARGKAIGALLTHAAIWDIAAGLAILRAAGGTTLTLSGNPLNTASMRDGQLLPEPIIVGEQSHAHTLRTLIQQR